MKNKLEAFCEIGIPLMEEAVKDETLEVGLPALSHNVLVQLLKLKVALLKINLNQ